MYAGVLEVLSSLARVKLLKHLK